MTEEFEDPRKGILRERAEAAVDAAGFSIDLTRPVIAYAPGSGLRGGIRGDVVADGDQGARSLYFVRVDGSRPLPQWLANYVSASFALANVAIFVVVEAIGDQLRATCEAAGAGLLRLRPDDTFEMELDYKAPDQTAERRRFQARVKTARTRLDTKLRLNQAKLETTFQESSAVTTTMTGTRREEYLTDIENAMMTWRTWAEEMAERLDALAAAQDLAALTAIEAQIVSGPAGVAR